MVDQPGKIEVVRHGHHLRRPFLDIRSLVSFDFGERGLLSMALPPGYPKVRRFYVYFTNNQGNIEVDEFKRGSLTRARRGSRRKVIEIPHPSWANHNGGQLQFNGNLLYFGTGDGGSGGDPRNNAQNTSRLLGKLIRIDPRNPPGKRNFTVPRVEPVRRPAGARPDLRYGLRNPFRFSFDRVSAVAAADRDRRRRPERLRGGRLRDPGRRLAAPTSAGTPGRGSASTTATGAARPIPGGTTKPIFAYGHSRGCAIIGGYVVRDQRLPGLDGRYVYTDNCNGTLRSLSPHLGGPATTARWASRVTAPELVRRGRPWPPLRDLAQQLAHGGKVFRLVRRR